MEEFKQVIDTLDEVKDKKVDAETLYEMGDNGKYMFKFVPKAEYQQVTEKSEASDKEHQEKLKLAQEEIQSIRDQIELKDKQASMSTGKIREDYEKERAQLLQLVESKSTAASKMTEEIKEMGDGYEKAMQQIEELKEESRKHRLERHNESIYKKLESTFLELGIDDPAYKNDIHAEATKVFKQHVDYGMIGYDEAGKEMFSKDQDGNVSDPTSPAEWLKSQLRNGKKASMWKQGCTKFETKGSGIANIGDVPEELNDRQRAKKQINADLDFIINGPRGH